MRLKSLDEPTNKQIADPKKVDAIMKDLYKTSKTYNHNKLIDINSKNQKPNLFIRIIKTIIKFIRFCLKCFAYFIIGYIVLIIITLILKSL